MTSILSILFLTGAYLVGGFLVQRAMFRIKVNEGSGYDHYSGGYHRRRIPDPSVPFWQRLGVMFFWGIPFLVAIPLFLGKGVFPVAKVIYRVVMGDTWPTAESPPKELLDLPPDVREGRRVEQDIFASVLFSLLALCGLAWWVFFTRRFPGELVSILTVAYLAIGFLTQRDIYRIKVGRRNGMYHRRIVPDPAVSLRERLATVLFWGVFIPGDLWVLWLGIFEGLKVGYRWVIGDTEPDKPIPPEEVLFPEEQVARTIDQIPAEKDLRVPQNGHEGAATQAALAQTEELVGAGSINKN